MLSCALSFYSIGAYAQKLNKPMGFWANFELDASKITNIEEYNRENAIMWKLYSLWFIFAAIAELLSMIFALIILISSAVVGIPLLIFSYRKILKKHTKNSV